MDYIENISGLLNKKLIIGAFLMILISSVVITLIVLLFMSIKSRREAIAVNLPDINENGEIQKDPVFKEQEELVVELIEDEEIDLKNSKIVDNEEDFLTALSYETKKCFALEKDSNLEMPEIGVMDYDKIKEEKKKERDESFITHYKELAEADKVEGFDPQKLNIKEE